jgi:hypothetical protein
VRSLLSQELADEAAPSIQTRQLAGLSLKNFMTSKDHGTSPLDQNMINPDISVHCSSLATLSAAVQLNKGFCNMLGSSVLPQISLFHQFRSTGLV